jgi:hypothetical protein
VSTTEKALSTIAQEVYRGTIANSNANTSTGVITSSNITSNRLNSNAFTPLLAVVNANSGYANGNNSINNSLSPLIPSHPSISTTEKSSAANPAILPHGSFRCNLGNNAIAAAASQAIAATQQVCYHKLVRVNNILINNLLIVCLCDKTDANGKTNCKLESKL